ncbi:SUF system Fe-S cluster assembly protein [Pseudogulbenkiania sp. MAI-1]|uniref:SUF system Fe-S cluster assembly protein n=1 Tax=Pseudogulbenkiania sp. MAI-1 TaxID=990370 RepID=UPI00045E6ED6|nr:SUF system Fe-S cluster assembly protein [Pseudogulbenkiania sp. MAI-1]
MGLFDWLHHDEQTAARPVSELEARVIEALRTVYDPEIPVNIYDLGLVYALDVDAAEGKVHIDLTLTAPGCPVAQTFPGLVAEAVERVDGVHEAEVELVWEPPWSQDMMSEAARLELGLL